MSDDTLTEFVAAKAEEFGIPGVAVGMWANGREVYACRGVTSVDNPLPVDQDTLYLLGSITKTYTATALMRLVAEGRVRLDAPVRRYVPELRLADERTAAEVTVLNLLNHTSGLGVGYIADTGEGDDALADYVAKLTELELVAPPGTRHPSLVQPGGLQPGWPDCGEGHGADVRAGRRIAGARAAGAVAQLLRPR